jgi:hypothetical protein
MNLEGFKPYLDEDEFKKSLLPCPFCGGGEMRIDVTRIWGPINRPPTEIVSVVIHHWCERLPGQLFSHIEVRGRDAESARAGWNKRAQ